MGYLNAYTLVEVGRLLVGGAVGGHDTCFAGQDKCAHRCCRTSTSLLLRRPDWSKSVSHRRAVRFYASLLLF